MDRKVALATAAAVVLTVSAGTAAVAANLGLLSSADDDIVGQLQSARDDEGYEDDEYEGHDDGGYEEDEYEDQDGEEDDEYERDDDDGRDDDD